MSATASVIPPAPLFYRHLQIDLARALHTSDQNYNAQTQISPTGMEELWWWDCHMRKWNGRTLLKREIDMVIELDASHLGWGASCLTQRTGGPWTKKEQTMHINCMELLAAILATKTFAKTK